MKKIILTVAIAMLTWSTYAQVLPKPSPDCEVEQIVGATEIEINYSRPGVKEREIFGGLVPFEKLWRFGANSATTISMDHSLFFEGQELEAGTYSVFAIPNKENWEIIFNKNVNAGTGDYSDKEDVIRVKGEVKENSYTETFTIGFDKIKDASASIVVLWEKTRVEIPFTLDTETNSKINIEKAIEAGKDLGAVYSSAANYYYSSMKDMDQANKYVDLSLKEETTYRNMFMKARILKEQGDKKGAVKFAEKALDLANEAGSKGYYNFISGTLDNWSKE